MTPSAPKTYILDTNVLLHDPHSLLNFQDNTVLIPSRCWRKSTSSSGSRPIGERTRGKSRESSTAFALMAG